MNAPGNPLIIALDVDSAQEALSLVERIGPAAGFYKVGMELYAAAGMSLVKQICATRCICQSAAPAFLTVHGSRSVMQAAVEGRAGSSTKLLAVTVLTSFDQDDLADLGYPNAIADLVDLRVRKARESGIDGIVCSPLELARVRQVAGPGMKLVTPGVRSAGADKGDQKRVATPAEALSNGADYLVIGRQVTRAADPRAACEQILAEVQTPLSAK